MLSQLNYKAAAYLNGGDGARAPAARCAHLLRAGAAVRDGRRPPRAVRDPRRVLAPALRGDRSRPSGRTIRASPPCTRAFENRAELLDALGARLKEAPRRSGSTASARSGSPSAPCRPRRRARRRARACSAGWSSRSTPQTDRCAWSAARSGSTAQRAEYRPPPRLHEHTDEPRRPARSTSRVRRRSRRRPSRLVGIAWQVRTQPSSTSSGAQRVVHAHRRGSLVEVGHARRAAPRLARERRAQARRAGRRRGSCRPAW